MPRALLVCLLIVGLSASAAATELPGPLAQALKRYGLSAHGLSLYVHEIGRREAALAFAADIPRNPASTIKILTTLVALEELTPAYQWKTEAYATGPLVAGRLEGDLYFKGYGDPFLVIEHFWRFLRALRQLGVEVIAGDLVLDQSHFVPPPGNPSDFDGRPHRAYNVLPAALLINFQTVGLRFVPVPAEQRVHVIADPLPAHVTVENRLRLTQRGCRGWAHRLGMQVAGRPAGERIILTGEYDAGCGENEMFRVVAEPAAYIHGVFRALWAELGGRLEGIVREGATPTDARLLHTAYSPPLADIVRAVNKFSNNVMTRQLLLTLGAERFGPPGTEEKGVAALHAWLARRGLDFPELVLENGAGLSRRERISARHLGALLLAAYESPYMPELLSSLPIASLDGTVRRRFAGTPLEGRVHLKTGSLNNVRSLAGYVLDRAGRRVAVVMLHNHPQADTVAAEALQDEALRWVYER